MLHIFLTNLHRKVALSAERVAELKADFKSYDKNRDGFLTSDQFKLALESTTGQSISDDYMIRLVNLFLGIFIS